MRYSLFQILATVLVVALLLALFVSQKRFRMQIREYEEKAVKRERLEDKLEAALLDALAPGVSLDEYPHYRILVDDIVTGADPEFKFLSKIVGEMIGEAPSALADCEFHLFDYKAGVDTSIYAVIVRDNRCVEVTWVGANIAPR
ncbi:hypothetical protein Enr13x_53160 [Stieleria neptunia]|uniref:Uncharacterized protein n=1 Tax=Stieleria neptunia TaxID=2527979 RepID=A0A518HXI2_9BACT|nr:hypothetical protein [Stieleria neptunia]QDV45437.1 hypothetical protein Enr13x_53160 [Stieleria neptunia]